MINSNVTVETIDEINHQHKASAKKVLFQVGEKWLLTSMKVIFFARNCPLEWTFLETIKSIDIFCLDVVWTPIAIPPLPQLKGVVTLGRQQCNWSRSKLGLLFK